MSIRFWKSGVPKFGVVRKSCDPAKQQASPGKKLSAVPTRSRVASLKFHEDATAEYLASLIWYAERNNATAIEFQNAVETAVRRIIAAPESFPSFDVGTRFVIVDRFPFSIIYEQIEAAIQVVAVAHSSRRPGYWRYRR